MKKVIRSFVSLLLILSMIIIDVPVGSYAAGNTTVPSIRNVKLVKDDITFWGANNYCIYEIDGVQFDSRKMSAKFNAMAWRAMETGDRRRVNQRFWNLKERKEVFGDDMAIEMGKWSDDILGWTAVRDELAKKWEERYTKELMFIYGNEYFEQTYIGLTTFEVGSDAHTVLTNYADDPLAEDFMKKYNALILDINVGKTKGYDYAVSTVLKAREMGTKAISKELIGIIVSNFMTPTMTLAGPSKATAVTTDLVTKTFDLCDQIAQISGTIQDKTVSKEAQSTSDAAAWIRELDKIIDVELQLAQHGYDEACKFREQLEADAPGILEAIRKRDKEKTADIRRYEEERDERQEKCVSAGDVGPVSIGDSSSYDPLAYEQEKNVILAKLDAWREEIENDTKKQIENAGFELFPDDYEFDQAKMNEHGIYGNPSDWTMQDAANVDHTDYYSLDTGIYACYTPDDLSKNSMMYWGYEYIPPVGIKAWEEDLKAQDAHNKRKADRLDALGTGVPGLFQQYYSSYQPIAVAAAELDAAYEGSELLAACNREAYEHLNRLNKIPSNPAECEWLRNYVKEYKEKGEFAIKSANSEAFKQWLSDSSVEYEKIRTDFELAHSEYLKDLQECKDIINKKIPQYVRDQKGDPNIGFIQPYNINKDLKEEISKKSNKEQYLKREADNLTDLYDQFMEYRRQCDIDQKIMQKYLGQLNEISSSLVYRYEELESIDSSYGYYNGSNLYTLFEASKNATFSDEDPFWSDKVMIASGNDGMVYTLDDELAAKLGLTPDEYRYARMMPVLAADFSGATVYHADFVAAYNELKSVKGVVLRQLKQGDHTLLQKYTRSIRSAYNNCQSCYNDTFAGIGTKNAINIAKEAYWEDGIIWQLEEKARTYIPTTRIEGGGNQRLNSLNTIMSDGENKIPDLFIQPGSSGRLLVDVIPANATERGLIFTSIDPQIATVDEDGVVTGIAEGTTTVRVVSEDAPATINYVEGSSDVINNFTVPEEFVLEFAIEVSNNAPLPAEASSLELSADKTNIGDGEIATIIADVEPQNASAIVEWSVSPSSVAQISSGYEGEWGESASGWRSYVKGLTTGTATVTAKTSNGITKSIQIKVTQSPVNVLDSSGTLLYKCNDLKEAKTWVLKEWKDNPQDIGTYTVKLNSDMNLDETNEEYHEGALVYRDNYTSSDEKIFITFDLGGNTLSIKRAQYNELALYTGTTVKNGLLRVEGPEGLTVYGDVVLDSVSAPRIFASTAFKGEIFVAENAIVSELFINDYNMTSQIGNLTGNGGINCVNGSTLFADTISCTGELSLRPDSKVYVNTSAVVGSVLAFDEGSGSIARYKDASLTITGDIQNQGSGVLYVGITDKKVSNEDLTGEGIALSEITPQTLMFMTGQKSVPSFVKLWQPESAQYKDLVLSVSEGGAYAVVKGTAPKPVVEIEKISKLVTDKKNVSIGTGKSVTIKVTAFTGDGDAVNRPQVAWTENKKNSVITIESVNPADGTVTVKGINPGTAALTATATDGSKKKVSCTVKVGASIENIKITQKKGLNSVECGKKLALTADISPKKPAPVVKTLIWTSEDPNIAVVNSKGEVTGISKGSTKITAIPADSTYDATKSIASFDITVTEATKAKSITSIKVKQGKNVYANGSVINNLAVGKGISLKAYTVDPAKNKEVGLTAKDVVFYSSDEQIVSVTPAGKITAKAEGSATVTVVSLKDAGVKSTIKVNSYVAVKKIELNTRSRKVNKGGIGILTVAQFTPLDVTDQRIKWTATGVDGNTKPGNVQAIEAAVLPAGKTVADLTNTDFKDIRVNPVITGKGDRLVYRTLKATKKCVVTAVSVDGNKKATTTVISNGEVTGLTIKTTKTITGANGNYSVNIKAGKSITIKPVITAEYGADKTLIWSSDNDMITVKNGKITVGKTAPSGTKAVVSANDLNANCKLTINVTVQ